MHRSSAEDGGADNTETEEAVQPRGHFAFLQFQITPQSTPAAAAAAASATQTKQSAESSQPSAPAAPTPALNEWLHHIDVCKTDKANIISIHVFVRVPPGKQIDLAPPSPAAASSPAHAATDRSHTEAATSNSAMAPPAMMSSSAMASASASSSSSVAASSSPLLPIVSSVCRVELPSTGTVPSAAFSAASSTAASSSSAAPPTAATAAPAVSLLRFSIPSYNFAKDNYLAASSHLLHTYAHIFAALYPESTASSSSSSPSSASAASLTEENLSVLIEKAVEASYLSWVSRERTSSNSALISLLSSLRIAWDSASAFVDQEVQLSDLLCLTEHDLKSFLPKLGPRRRLTQWIVEERRRRGEGPTASEADNTETEAHTSVPDSSRVEAAASISSSPTPMSPKSGVLSPSRIDGQSEADAETEAETERDPQRGRGGSTVESSKSGSKSVEAEEAEASASDDDEEPDASDRRRMSSTMDSNTDAPTEQSEQEQEQEPDADEPSTRAEHSLIDESVVEEEEADASSSSDSEELDSAGATTRGGATEASELEQTEQSELDRTEDTATADSETEQEEEKASRAATVDEEDEADDGTEDEDAASPSKHPPAASEYSDEEDEVGESVVPIDALSPRPLQLHSPSSSICTHLPSPHGSPSPAVTPKRPTLPVAAAAAAVAAAPTSVAAAPNTSPPLDPHALDDDLDPAATPVQLHENHEDGYEGHDDSDDEARDESKDAAPISDQRKLSKPSAIVNAAALQEKPQSSLLKKASKRRPSMGSGAGAGAGGVAHVPHALPSGVSYHPLDANGQSIPMVLSQVNGVLYAVPASAQANHGTAASTAAVAASAAVAPRSSGALAPMVSERISPPGAIRRMPPSSGSAALLPSSAVAAGSSASSSSSSLLHAPSPLVVSTHASPRRKQSAHQRNAVEQESPTFRTVAAAASPLAQPLPVENGVHTTQRSDTPSNGSA